jgi:hypothetical protein
MTDANGRERYLLAWLDGETSISARTLLPIRRAIEDTVDRPRDEVEVDVWLESPGGDANAAYKLALILRDAAAHVRVVVPDYAKSAATLLTLAGDEIYLAPGAEMGPLDAQMPEEGSLAGVISALNIARAADEVARDAVDLAVQGGADLLQITGLSRAQTIDAMLRFSAEFSEPLVRQLDPKIVHHAKQMLRVTARYAEHLLAMTGCSRAGQIANRLVENFPTHGYVIAYDEARQLGLPVRPLGEYEFLEPARGLHRAAEDGQTIIQFSSFDEAGLTTAEDQGGEQEHEQSEEPEHRLSTQPGPDGAEASPTHAS